MSMIQAGVIGVIGAVLAVQLKAGKQNTAFMSVSQQA